MYKSLPMTSLKLGFGKKFKEKKDGCLSYLSGNPSSGYDYDCEYPYSGEITCDDCMFGGHGGKLDPRKPRSPRKTENGKK